jgi:UDPglucose 6-dehydrogenase
MNKVLIVGCGYVGSAIASVFKKKELTIIDPKFNNNKISNFKNKPFDAVFVCVDTPEKENFKLLDSILHELNTTLAKNTIVCCKSTASPVFYEQAEKRYKNISVLFSPEYLSHWNNIKDFQNQEFLIVGGCKQSATKVVKMLTKRLKKIKTVEYTDIKTAALVKYSENGFLALKVTFANELYKIHKKLKCKSSFINFAKLVGLDARIGPSHFEVPGRDKSFGWGGHCFNKDNYEFEKFSKSPLIKFMIKLNKTHRKKVVEL